MDAHLDVFIKDSTAIMKSIIGRPVCCAEGFTALFASISSAPALAGFIERMSDDIALVEYPMERASWILAAVVGDRLEILHTCFMPENGEEIHV